MCLLPQGDRKMCQINLKKKKLKHTNVQDEVLSITYFQVLKQKQGETNMAKY